MAGDRLALSKLLLAASSIVAVLGAPCGQSQARDLRKPPPVIHGERIRLFQNGDGFVASQVLAVLTDPRLLGRPNWDVPDDTSRSWQPRNIVRFETRGPYSRSVARIAKWVSPIKVWVADRGRYGDDVANLIKEISEATSVNMRLVGPEDRRSANFVVRVFEPNPKLDPERYCLIWPCSLLPESFRRAVGRGIRVIHDLTSRWLITSAERHRLPWNKPKGPVSIDGELVTSSLGQISEAECRVRRGNQASRQSEEDRQAVGRCLLHGMGLVNTADYVTPVDSALSGRKDVLSGFRWAPAELKWFDRLALEALYDRRLSPGMSSKRAYPIIQSVVAEWRKKAGIEPPPALDAKVAK